MDPRQSHTEIRRLDGYVDMFGMFDLRKVVGAAVDESGVVGLLATSEVCVV